jgi:hypothetical protein
MAMEPGAGQTTLIGEIRDQSHLYGILDRVRSLGLELVSVEPIWTDQTHGDRGLQGVTALRPGHGLPPG